MKISSKSFQKFGEFLNFRNANHSTENSGNIGSKINGMGIPCNKFANVWVISQDCDLFQKSPQNAVPFDPQLEMSGNSNWNFCFNGKLPVFSTN